jgi:hypothetical protein
MGISSAAATGRTKINRVIKSADVALLHDITITSMEILREHGEDGICCKRQPASIS